MVLVSCGSFNPPSIMHLRMFELAADALRKASRCLTQQMTRHPMPARAAGSLSAIATVAHALRKLRVVHTEREVVL